MKHLSILFILFAVLLTSCGGRVTNVLSLEYFQDSTSQIVEVYKHDHKFNGEQGKFKALHPFMEAQFDSLKAQYITVTKYGSTTPY